MAPIPDEVLARPFRLEQARALVGQSFEVFGDDPAAAPLRLAVKHVDDSRSAPHMVQFSVVFSGPPAPTLAQRTYRFRHAQLGEFAFLVVPTRATREAIDYEACFSHAP